MKIELNSALTSRRRPLAMFALSFCALLWVAASGLQAQLPPEAVDLALVKISEKLTSVDLCPVHLVPSDADGESWSFQGVAYRGSEPGSKDTFLKSPDQYVTAAAKERWIENFMLSMSTIWCPITDEVTPGGRMKVEGLGHTWESCCSFCDEEMTPDNFKEALVRLRDRAEESYDLVGGKYDNSAKSPVEGAIKEGY